RNTVRCRLPAEGAKARQDPGANRSASTAVGVSVAVTVCRGPSRPGRVPADPLVATNTAVAAHPTSAPATSRVRLNRYRRRADHLPVVCTRQPCTPGAVGPPAARREPLADHLAVPTTYATFASGGSWPAGAPGMVGITPGLNRGGPRAGHRHEA